jgi:hypothetical protein
VRVLGRDPIGELVQIRLPHDAVAALLEPLDRLRRPLGDVLGEQDRPVRGAQAGRVEEVFDGERDPSGRLLGPGEENPVEVGQSSAR